MWHLQTGPKSKKWSESIRRIFSKRGTNLNCALLIFDPRSIAHLQPKKYQMEQKVIIVSIKSWMQIGPCFWLIWIAPWLFLISVIFRGYTEVKVGPKTQILGASCLCLKSSFPGALNGICTTMRTTCVQNFSSIWRFLLELLSHIVRPHAPLLPRRMVPIGSWTKIIHCFF